MRTKIKIFVILTFLIISSFTTLGFSKETIKHSSIDGLSNKQEIEIPIDTNLEYAKFQPIDIRVKFDDSCWAKNEEEHSVRVAYDDGSGLTEIDSQIYDLEHTDETHISSCSLVFIIPDDVSGNEKYYVLYDSSETEGPGYEDHITVEDTHYYYEPISGQKIDFDYYGIRQDEDIVYGVIQTGELLGNPVALAAGKFVPGTKEVETQYLDQLGVFDIRTGTVEQPGYVGTSWADSVEKSILVDGNLMTRLRIIAKSPSGDLKSDNIYTYYYNPSETKSISVDFNHECLEEVNIEESSIIDGAYSGIVSIKARSATIDKMNVGEILPELRLYSKNDQIEDYEFPSNPDSVERQTVLGTEADIDLGSKAWICCTNPDTGLAHSMILDSVEGITESDFDGAQAKAWAKQNVKLPGLEADSGNLYIMRNAYENGEHKTTIPEGFKASGKVNFMTTPDGGYELVDKHSEIFQKLAEKRPSVRGNVTDAEEKTKYSLDAFVHLAPSPPMGALLSAATGKKIPYIYAEIYKEDSLKSSGSATRLPIASVELDFEGKKFFEKIKTVVNIFDWRNISLFKKISFPDLEEGTYVIKVFRENPVFSEERQFLGFRVVDLKENSSCRIFCSVPGSLKVSVMDQNEEMVKDVKILLRQSEENISEGFTDENGTVEVSAPCYPLKPYELRVLYQGFLVEEKTVRFGFLKRFIPLSEEFSFERYDLEINVKDSWGFKPGVELNPRVISEDMFETVSISAEKVEEGVYVFKDLYKADYVLSMGYKDLEFKKSVTVGSDSSLDVVFDGEFELSFNVMDSFGQSVDSGRVVVSREGVEKSFKINKDGEVVCFVPPADYKMKVFSDDGDLVAKQDVSLKSKRTIEVVSTVDSLLHLLVTVFGFIVAIGGVLYFGWKRDYKTALKVLIVGLLIVSLVSSWWMVSGQENGVSTETKTLLIPSKIVTVTEASEGIGGEVSMVPEEVTMVLNLVFMLVVGAIIVVLVTIFTQNRFKKTNIMLSIVGLVLLFVAVFVFHFGISQLAEVSVGDFMGSGDLDVSIPGGETLSVDSSWGPGLGFIFGVISLAILVFTCVFERLKGFYIRKKEEKND